MEREAGLVVRSWYPELVGAMVRDTHASAVVSLDADPGMLDLTGPADEIAANVSARWHRWPAG